MENLKIPYDFIEKYVRFTNPEYLQVYLYAAYKFQKDGKMPTVTELTKELCISEDKVKLSLDFWKTAGEIIGETKKDDGGAKKGKKSFGRSKPSYTVAEIDEVCNKSEQISQLLKQAEHILNKHLTQSDLEMLYSFHDWLGLPVEVIVMLLAYAAKKGKTTKRYLETVAMDWADRGIDTYESAEAFVSELEAFDSYERKVRGILGIYDRALTQTEKKYLKQWCEELQVPLELVQLSYDRTVEHTGKLSWAYMNKIITEWLSKGLTTKEQVENEDAPHTEQFNSKTKKSKFNNYEDTNKIDYADLENKLFDMIDDF